MQSRMPDGSVYNYSVGAPGAIGVDVVGAFRDSCTKAGLGHGYYYSLHDNAYLNAFSDGKVRACPLF